MTKISQLTDIGANLAAGDEFLIRDVSDASTPNKKVTSSGFVDYIIAQGTGAGFTQIAAGVGPLARALATSSGATGTLTFSTAAATTLIERARIDSAGRLLVGTSTALAAGGALVQFNGGTNSSAAATLGLTHTDNTNSGSIQLGGLPSGSSTSYGSKFRADGDGNLIIDTYHYQGGSYQVCSLRFHVNSTERMRIDSAGRVLVGTSTANASGAKLQTSDGLTFPATAVASADPNTLDDYEEGTWTPVLNGFTIIGATTVSGQYTKIGRIVYLRCSISAATSIASTAATSNITGLPFSSDVQQNVPLPITDTSFGAVTYGTGLCRTDGKFYTPTWTATSQTISMSTTFNFS